MLDFSSKNWGLLRLKVSILLFLVLKTRIIFFCDFLTNEVLEITFGNLIGLWVLLDNLVITILLISRIDVGIVVRRHDKLVRIVERIALGIVLSVLGLYGEHLGKVLVGIVSLQEIDLIFKVFELQNNALLLLNISYLLLILQLKKQIIVGSLLFVQLFDDFC